MKNLEQFAPADLAEDDLPTLRKKYLAERAKGKTLTSIEVDAALRQWDNLPLPIGDYLRHRAPTRELLRILKTNPDPAVRVMICSLLDSLQPRSARHALLVALFDEDEGVRESAADAYGKVGRSEDGPIVLGAYRLESSPSVRGYLVIALGAIGFQGAVPLLISLLRDHSRRQDAAWSLRALAGTTEMNCAALEAAERIEKDPWAAQAIRSLLAICRDSDSSPSFSRWDEPSKSWK